MLILVSAEKVQEKVKKVANKRERSRLDQLREEIGMPIHTLNKMLPNVIGRRVSDFSQLSVGENKFVVEWMKANQGRLEKECRENRWKRQ